MSRVGSLSRRVMGSLAVMTAALAVVVSAANAGTYEPTITPHETYASYTGGYVPFTVSGFDASEWVRVEILGPAPNLQPLGVDYVNSGIDGSNSGTVYSNNSLCSVTGGLNVYLAADGEPGPTAWTQASIKVPTCPIVWRPSLG
jgi:hypothetical protein